MSQLLTGLKAWALQRLSAAYMGLYLTYFIAVLLLDKPEGYGDWLQWLSQPLMSIATLVFVLGLLVHTWIGMRDIFMDYVNLLGLRAVLLALLLLLLMAYGLWAAKLLMPRVDGFLT